MRKIAANAATTTAATMPRITALPYGPDGLNTAVSTRKDTVDIAELPARSYASTVTVCDPSASPDNTNEVVVAEKLWGEPPSRLTSKWSIPLVASDPVHRSVAEEAVTTEPCAGFETVTVGGAVSTVKDTTSEPACPALSYAVTLTVCVPSETPVKSVESIAEFTLTDVPPSRETSK